MRIITQNVKKWAGQKQVYLAQALINLEPSILVLTEHRERKEADKARAIFKSAGYSHSYVSIEQENTNRGGILVLSKYPLQKITIPQWQAEEDWWVLFFKLNDFVFSAAYWPQKQAKHACWEAWLAASISIKAPYLSLGDFNTGRNDVDKMDSGAKFYCAEFFDHLTDNGLIDLWRDRHIHEREYSWFSRAKNGFRIDHAFGNLAMNNMVKKCWYDHYIRERALSDHSTLLLDIASLEI